MKIQTASIIHKYGTNDYTSRTDAGLEKQIAAYCREWWGEVASDLPDECSNADGDAPSANMTDAQIIVRYFNVMNDREREWLEYDSSELGD